MIRHLRLTEGEPAKPFELTDAEAEALHVADLAVVARPPGATAWHVAAGTKIGVARVGELQVTVRPKVSMARLIFLMGYSKQPDLWRDQDVELAAEADLVEALSEAFRRQSAKALEQGLLHGYRTVDDSLAVLRGRVRVGDQVARRFGLDLPLEVTYDDFTVDIAENQLLLAAAHRLLRAPGVSDRARRALQRLRLQLADVTPVVPGVALPRWVPSRLNVRYQPALRLADLVLAGDSFEQRVADLRVSGFVITMWKVYEDFVCTALGEALEARGGRARPQQLRHLDVARSVPMRPDLLWSMGKQPLAVVDAKYKAEKYDGFPNADLYQLLAYCTVLGLAEGHLVYAAGNEASTSHVVTGSGITIHCHALDLGLPPGPLLQQVDRLAEGIALTRAMSPP